jgi:hypothetical protein
MENACMEIDNPESANWEDKAASMASDPNASPVLKSALAEALEQDPVDAVKNAEILYQILLQRALDQPATEWKWRSQPTYCWVCNSHNTRLVASPGYGIVHECLNCNDNFLLEGAIQWVV